MTTSFSQFLQDRAAKEKAAAEANKAVIDEWRAAVLRLFEQLLCVEQ